MHTHEVSIQPGRAEREYWKDLWRYRELFYFLAWRDLLVRYKQTVVGAAWGFVRPFLTMLVLTFVFGRLAGMPSSGVEYPLLVLCGVLPWQFFSTAVAECGNSLVSNSGLISKVYFPRMTIPASSVITGVVDMMISGCLLALLLVWYRHPLTPQILLLPVFIALAFAAAFGAGLWISALTVKYRDFRFIIPFIVQFGLYISPVGFSSQVVPEQWRLLYSLNPFVAIIDGFRWSVLGGEHRVDPMGLALAVITIGLTTVLGIRYFRRTERTFADVI